MSDLQPRPKTTLVPARGAAPMIVGGLVIGTLALVALGAAAVAVFQVTLTAVTVGAYVAVIAAFWFLWPALVYSLRVARLRIEDAVTRGNPLEALELERGQFEELIKSKTDQLANASGELRNFERLYQGSKADLPEERRLEWENQISSRQTAYQTAQRRLDELKGQLVDFDKQIKTARAELQMAEADASLAQALNRTGVTPDLSRKTRTAIDSITKEIGRSSAKLEEALKEV